MKNIMCLYGLKMSEAVDNLNDVLSKIPPIEENEIQRIKSNPNLNYNQKKQLLKRFKV